MLVLLSDFGKNSKKIAKYGKTSKKNSKNSQKKAAFVLKKKAEVRLIKKLHKNRKNSIQTQYVVI